MVASAHLDPFSSFEVCTLALPVRTASENPAHLFIDFLHCFSTENSTSATNEFTHLVSLFVALLNCWIYFGPSSAELLCYFCNWIVWKLRLYFESLLLRKQEVGREWLLRCIQVFHGLLVGFLPLLHLKKKKIKTIMSTNSRFFYVGPYKSIDTKKIPTKKHYLILQHIPFGQADSDPLSWPSSVASYLRGQQAAYLCCSSTQCLDCRHLHSPPLKLGRILLLQQAIN